MKKLHEQFLEKGKEIGKILVEKNSAYGNSFVCSGEILKILYPNGVSTNQCEDALALTRIIDKMFRIANKKDGKDQMGESPYKDICGYSMLGWVRDEMKEYDVKKGGELRKQCCERDYDFDGNCDIHKG